MNWPQAKNEARSWLSEFGAVCCGRIVAIDAEGHPVVDFRGNPGEPARARCIHTMALGEGDSWRGLEVLLVFEHSDPAFPIIVGVVQSTLTPPREVNAALSFPEGPRQATVDGRQVLLKGEDEVKLVCGKSSITLTKDGRISLRGVEIVSCAAAANKIRGASVAIN